MRSKFQNKIKQFLYRPVKKSTNMEFVVKKLDEAENALDATVGGAFGGKKRGVTKKGDKKKEG